MTSKVALSKTANLLKIMVNPTTRTYY